MWVDTKQFQHVGAELAGVFAEAEGTCSSTDDKEKCAQRQRPPVVRLPSCRSFLSPLCPFPSPPLSCFLRGSICSCSSGLGPGRALVHASVKEAWKHHSCA